MVTIAAVVIGGAAVGVALGVGLLILAMELSDGRTEFGW